MTLLQILVLSLIFAQNPVPSGQEGQNLPDPRSEGVIFREPFTLKLKGQGGSNFEQHFDKTPYVKDGMIYIFPGEKFGVNAAVDGEKIAGLSYVSNPAKADVRLEFAEKVSGGNVMTLLIIENHLKQTLYLDAGMRVPNREGAYKTSVLPVLAGKSGFESWPHPIVLLMLRNLRFTK
jgi:hypothetical protein